MKKMLTLALLPIAALAAATPATAGPTEAAVALCKAEFVKQLNTAQGESSLTVRSIDAGGKVTRVRIAANTRNIINCRIDYHGTLVSAVLEGTDKAAAVQQANR